MVAAATTAKQYEKQKQKQKFLKPLKLNQKFQTIYQNSSGSHFCFLFSNQQTSEVMHNLHLVTKKKYHSLTGKNDLSRMFPSED